MAIGRQALDGRLARSEHSLVVGMWTEAPRIFNDLVGYLAVDGSAKPLHQTLQLL